MSIHILRNIEKKSVEVPGGVNEIEGYYERSLDYMFLDQRRSYVII